ncbi:MAG: hypothetical protein HYX96_05470 [Chloroflexi bacterium]|nr:hypothetical protein [Chloroflexota bacterium]
MMRPGWKARIALGLKKTLGMNVILCSSCKWDWRGACRNAARPNATLCDEYKKRG